jgi:hypothetical protein
MNVDASAKGSETFKEQTLVFLLCSLTLLRTGKSHMVKLVCDYKPNKAEKERVRLTVGGDSLDYSGYVATSTADITTFKYSSIALYAQRTHK